MGANTGRKENDEASLKYMLAITMADVDIFLLQNEEQTEDLDKLYTKEEIRIQLKSSLNKIINLFQDNMVDSDLPIFPALKFYTAVHHPDISDNELISLRKEHQELFGIK